MSALALAIAALALLAFAPLSQAKEITKFFGTTGFGASFGGDFNGPLGIAVNSSGVGAPAGTIYVVDGNNNRIERFDRNNRFVSAWGKDVIAPTIDERQSLVVDAGGGTFQLTFDGVTTAPIDYINRFGSPVASFEIDDALDALSSVGGDANVRVRGSGTAADPFLVTFTGAIGATDFAQMSADTSQLEGTVRVASVADGAASVANDTGAGFEVCTVATECKAGVASGGDGTRAGNGSLNSPQGVAVDGDTGSVYVSDAGNRRINAYDASGNFLFSVGRDVQDPDGGATVEICDNATDTCRQGDSGSGPGEVGSGSVFGKFDIAVSPPDGNAATGKVYLADSGNQRVGTYDLDGTNPASFGSSANFGTGQPTRVAVDSRGIVYASDSNNNGEVDRFDSLDANGGGRVFLASIPASVNEVQKINFPGIWRGFDEEFFRLSCPNGAQTADIGYRSGGDIADNIEDALDAACGANNIAAGGSPFSGVTIFYHGAFGGRDVPRMDCIVVSSQSGSCDVTTLTEGRSSALFAGSTIGLAVDPDSDGGGADEDALYVLRSSSFPAPGFAIQQFGPLNDPGLAAPPAAADVLHGAGGGIAGGGLGGLGFDGAGGRLFFSNSTFSPASHRVYVLDDPLPDPAIVLNPVTTKTDTTATFTASVDPRGGLVRCAFQYSTDPGFASATDVPVPACASFSPDGGYQALSGKATGLDPNTHYFFRLQVTRAFDSNAVATSGYKDFFTDSVPPAVSDIGAVQVQDTSARLVGTIDPKNSATGYHFEYGTTPDLGSSTASFNIGGGSRLITVSQVVSGLSKDTDYYLRLVATNGFGTTNSATATFHTRAAPFPPADPGNCPNAGVRAQQGSTLPDCRAWEMVSPPDKNQGGVDQFFSADYEIGFGLDGSAVTFCTTAIFGDPSSQNVICAPYVSRRTATGATGWRTFNPFPSYCVNDRNGFTGIQYAALSPNLDYAALFQPESAECPFGLLDPGAPDAEINFYREDLSVEPFGYDLVTDRPVGETYASGGVLGGNANYSRIFYLSAVNQTADTSNSAQKIYEWEREGHGSCVTPGGCTSLVSRDTGNVPLAGNSDIPRDRNIQFLPNTGTISDDAGRIFFHNGPGTSQRLYMREDNARTYDLSTPECAVPADCGASQSAERFLWASPRGDVALFLSCDKLTDASAPSRSCNNGVFGFNVGRGGKLYRWDRDNPEGDRLTDLSVDHEPGDGVQPNAMDVLGASDDGDVVYMITGGDGTSSNGGQIVAGEPLGTLSGTGKKLFRVDFDGGSPTAEYLGPYVAYFLSGGSSPGLDYGQIADGTNDDVGNYDRFDRVTPDGGYLAITTPLALDAAADRDADLDSYRWDEGGGWTCVSCQLPGAPSAGSVNTVITECCTVGTQTYFFPGQRSHAISDDGRRIFFTANDPLVPQDTNGETSCPIVRVTNHTGRVYGCQDVYEWHDGTLSLLSSGTGHNGNVLLGADATGEDVSFVTRDRLLGWDTDNGADVYDARAGGGFPEPPPVPPVCDLAGGGCEGPGTVAPAIAGAGSRAFEGPENPRREPTNTCGRFDKQAQRKLAAAKKAARNDQAKQAQKLRKQARNLKRRATRCNRRNAS